MISIFFVTIGAGAAGALNMWYEADLDKLMTRTCLRPIPTGKVNKNQALVFGITLSIFSVIALDFFANRISASLLLFTILFYVFVYTIWLKRKTPQNIVIGGAAGALPPVIGWTIATNSLSLEPITFFLIIFFWTPSHFWALSLYKSDDYKKAKIPMLPLTDGVESTKLNIFVYSLTMLPVCLLYTSDAADDTPCVDLGGRRIIKKNVIGSRVKVFVAIVHPITGGKAPAAPPITIFCGVFLFSQIV